MERSTPNIEDWSTVGYRQLWTETPETALEAIMSAAPHTDIPTSKQEQQELNQQVLAAFDALPAQDQWIVNSAVWELQSHAKLGKSLGVSKSHSERLRKAAYARLRRYCIAQPLVAERMNVERTWNDAARYELINIAPDDNLPGDHHQVIANRMNEARKLFHANPDSHYTAHVLSQIGTRAAQLLSDSGLWSVDDMEKLLVSKQLDYGHGNINAFGMLGVIVRISDKVARLENLLARPDKPRNESLVDTLRDLVGYAVIARMLAADTFDLEAE